MNSGNQFKTQALAPQLVTGATAGTTIAGTAVSLVGFGYCQITVSLGTTTNSGGPTALQIQESDSTAGPWVAVPSLVVGTSQALGGGTSALPANTQSNTIIEAFNIDAKGRKKFVQLAGTFGNATNANTYVSAEASLSRAELAPYTAAMFGVREVLQSPGEYAATSGGVPLD